MTQPSVPDPASASVPTADDITGVLRLARVPNIVVKVSGLHYASAQPGALPYPGSRDLFAPDGLTAVLGNRVETAEPQAPGLMD